MPVNEHGDTIDEDWAPESPVLRGEVRTPDEPLKEGGRLIGPADQLPHRVRRDLGIDDQKPDPGYDPEGDDLL